MKVIIYPSPDGPGLCQCTPGYDMMATMRVILEAAREEEVEEVVEINAVTGEEIKAKRKVTIPAVTRPVTEEEFLRYVIAKDCKAGSVVVELDSLPHAFGHYFDAWRMDAAGVVTIDMPHARQMFMERLRRERDGRLASLDTQSLIAMEMNDPVRMAAVQTKKQALRDLPATLAPLVEGAPDPAELDRLWPEQALQA